jgi:Flp pilus assembly CpaE family ATPase
MTLVRALASSSSFDAVFVDEALAGDVSEARSLADDEGLPGAPSVYVVRSAADWRPVAEGSGFEGKSKLRSRQRTGPLEANSVADLSRMGGRATSGVRGETTDQPTLRDWWLGSLSASATDETSPPAFEVPRSPEVVLRQAIAVVSPKGGVGKTFLSVNLAAGLARFTDFRVVLVDLDIRSGDVAVHLDLGGRSTLADLLPYLDRLETGQLGRAIVTHGPSRLDVLLAPTRPESAETLSGEQLGALVRVLKQNYDFLVIDTPPDPGDPLVAQCLAEATAVVLVSSLDAASLRQCRLFRDALVAAAGGDFRRRLVAVVNQCHETGPIPAARALSFLQTPAGDVTGFHIPEDRAAVEKSIFDGYPLSVRDPAHVISRAVFGLAHSFCPVFSDLLEKRRPRRSGLGRLLDVIGRW